MLNRVCGRWRYLCLPLNGISRLRRCYFLLCHREHRHTTFPPSACLTSHNRAPRSLHPRLYPPIAFIPETQGPLVRGPCVRPPQQRAPRASCMCHTAHLEPCTAAASTGAHRPRPAALANRWQRQRSGCRGTPFRTHTPAAPHTPRDGRSPRPRRGAPSPAPAAGARGSPAAPPAPSACPRRARCRPTQGWALGNAFLCFVSCGLDLGCSCPRLFRPFQWQGVCVLSPAPPQKKMAPEQPCPTSHNQPQRLPASSALMPESDAGESSAFVLAKHKAFVSAVGSLDSFPPECGIRYAALAAPCPACGATIRRLSF